MKKGVKIALINFYVYLEIPLTKHSFKHETYGRILTQRLQPTSPKQTKKKAKKSYKKT